MANEFDDVLDQESAGTLPPLSSGLEKGEFDDVLDTEVSQQRDYVRNVIDIASKDNPEAAAERIRLSQSTGLPSDVVARNQQELKRREIARAIDLQRMMRDSPVLFRQMTDPTFTAAAIDDLDTLKQVERTLGDISLSTIKGAVGLPQAVVGLAGIPTFGRVGKALESIGYRPAEAQKIIESAFSPEMRASLARVEKADGFFDTLGTVLTEPRALSNTIIESLPLMLGGAGIARGLNAALLQIPGPAPLVLPALAAAAVGEGAIGAGAAASQIREQTGDGLLTGTQSAVALTSGVVTGLLGALGGTVANRFGLGDIDAALASGQLTGTPKAGFAKQVIGSGITEGFFEELPQSAQEQMWQNFALDRPILQGVANAAAIGLVAGAVTGGAFGTYNATVAKLIERTADAQAQVDQALSDAQRLQAAMGAAAQSQLRERSPETFQQLAEQIAAENEGAQSVFIDGQVLAQSGVDIAQAFPSLADQVNEAAFLNSTVEIPLAEVLTAVPGTPLEELFLQNAKSSPDALSQAEVEQAGEQGQQFIQQEAERVLQQAQEREAWQSEVDTVQQTIKDQLDQAGRFTSDVNEGYARLQSQFFSVMASRFGVMPSEMYERFSVKVAGQMGQGEVLNAGRQGEIADVGTVRTDGTDAIASNGSLNFLHGSNSAGLTVDQIQIVRDGQKQAKKGRKYGGFYLSSVDDIQSAQDYASMGDGTPTVYNVRIKEGTKILKKRGDITRLSETYIAELVAQGYGLVVGTDPRGRTEYVVIDNNAVESMAPATGNSGAFDPNDPNILRQSYAQQADALRGELEQAGASVSDTLPVDALINSDRIPVITLKDLIGKNVFPTIADRTGAAALYTGIDSSQLQISIPLLGGPFFPLRESNAQAGVAWANRGKSVMGQKAAKLKAGANYMMVVMGDANMHQSNTTVNNAFFGTLEAYVRDKRITKKNAAALTSLVRESKNADPMVDRYMKEFPGLDRVDALDEYLHRISFEARRRLLELLGNKGAQALGAPSMQRILDATREPSLAGQRWGDGVLVIEVDQESPMVTLGEGGTQKHPDYPLGIKGRVVGRLAAPVNYELLWQDWLSQAKQDALARGTSEDKLNPRRAFELAKPVVEVTQDLVDRIGDITQTNVDGPRQARLAADMAAGNWRVSGVAVNKGGVSPQEFIDAIQNSAAKATLTPYTLEEVKAGIKDGTMKLYQLGDGHIFFMLKTLPDGRKLLASVVNNEQGARGIGAPAVVLKAIEEGATDLDCFAVVNGKFPQGFLPALYEAFGFQKTTEYPFDPKYYREDLSPKDRRLALADAVQYWKDSTPGFNPDQGMPALVEMKWSGSDADRAGITERYLRSGLAGLLAGGTTPDVRALSAEFAAPDREANGAPSAADPGRAAGNQGAGAGSSVASRARSTVAGIADLTDNELRNLGLTAADRSAVRRALGRPDQPDAVAGSSGVFFQSAKQGRIRRTVDELIAAAESQKDWKTWYARHEQVLLELFGNDAELFQKILSATSQATGVKGNVSLALKAYDQLLSNQPFTGYLPAVIKNLERIRNEEALAGAKISQYGKANEGDTDAIAVDRHIAMLFFNTRSPNPRQIEAAKKRIRKIAAQLGWEPRQVQAALWAYNQVRLGTDPSKVESYDKILEARADFIAELRSRHGRGEGGGVSAGSGTVQAGQGRPGEGQLAQQARGTFNPQTLLIALGPQSDLSTFLHESGHFFLEVMADLAAQPDAPAQVREDMDKVLGWFGVPDLATWQGYTLDQKREHHEKWAESFEQYLLEGKAPSAELQPLFRRFRAWLVNVYKSLTDFMRGRNLELNDEIRQVFDRMLATDEQIAQAEEQSGLLPDFDATNAAIERLQERSMRALKWTLNARSKFLKQFTKEARELRKGVLAEVMAEFEQRPDVMASRAIRKVRNKDGAERDAKIAAIADATGYPTVEEMTAAVTALGPVNEAVEAEVDRRMLERHGDMATQEALEAAANEAVHNEARARALAAELKSQDEAMNPRETTGRTDARGRPITVNALVEAARAFGADLAARRAVGKLKNAIYLHRAAEARAGKAWQTATKKGDSKAAVQAKKDQLLNNQAVRALIDAQNEVRSAIEFFRKVTKGNNEKLVKGGRDPDVVNAMRAILGAYGIAPRTGKTALEYMELVQKNDPAMYGVIAPGVNTALANAKPFSELTVEEVRGLTDELKSLWHLAKRSRQMEIDGDLLDLEDLADQLYARMEDIGIPDVLPGETGALTDAELRKRNWLQQAPAILRRVEQWAEAKDGAFGGPFLRFIFQPVKIAADRYRADRLVYRQKFQALVDAIAPTMAKSIIAAPELDYTFGRGHNGIGMAEVLHAILHTGNDSNKRKLLLGRNWATENPDGTLDTSRWDAFIARLITEGTLTKAHYDFAQGVWDLMEETKPLAQKTHRDVFGRYFAEVTANPVTTPFGTYRGGYVPAQADPLLVQDADQRELLETENAGMSYAFPATNKGFTKGRVEYNRPLKLDLRTLPQHIDKVLLFSHMEPAVRSVDRLLRRKKIAQALNKIDPAAINGMLKPWLNRSARQTVETPVSADAGMNRMLSQARARTGMALMMGNLSNTLQQITGFSTALLKVKGSHMRRAVAQYIADPQQLKNTVWSLSPYMADRASNEVAVLSDTLEAILLNPSVYQSAERFTRRHAYFLQTAMDNQMSPIIWTGAYNQALAEGMEDRMARRYADGVIRQTQGSTLPEDVSRIETGTAFARAFTQFVSYFNMLANTNATALQQIAQEQGLRKGAGKAFGVLMLGMMIPIWVAEVIAQAFRGGPEDDEDDGYLDDWLAAVFGFGTIRGILSGVPGIAQIGQSMVNRFNDNPADDKFSLSPTVSVLESAAAAPQSVYKAIADEGSAQKAVRDMSALITVTTGLPAMTLARPLGYAAGVAQGKIEPTGPVDAARGVITGTASPESKNP